MSWYYNSRTGSVVEGGTPAAALALLPESLSFGAGWHGTFATKQDALDYYQHNKRNNPGWKAPSGIPSNLKNDVTTTPAATANAAKYAIKDVIGGFNLNSWFMRIGEVLLGLTLIGVGIAHLTGVDNLVTKTLTRLPIPI